MCRIVGIVDFKKLLGQDLEKKTVSMRDLLAHGGPDDAGLFLSKDGRIALGNRRLSILDLSLNGHQPMTNKDKTICVTYNGEIYNFNDLKSELKAKRYNFISGSDTEVLLYGYEEWGIEKLLSKLRGMFAFAIYDSREGVDNFKFYLARDRFGIKPLYYYHDSDYLIFASEVKAISHSKLVPDKENIEALIKFLQLGSVPVPLTTIKNVYSLPAAHYIELVSSNIQVNQYWDVLHLFHAAIDKKDYLDVVDSIYETLNETVKLHLVSDAPVGVFLSGGLDSSALCALASEMHNEPIKTLSIVFDEANYNEAKYSRLVAEQYNTQHHEIVLRNADFIDEIPNIMSAMDQPTIDGVNTYFISKAAKDVGLKAVLSGIGADEVFLGYKHFKNAQIMHSALKVFSGLPNDWRRQLVNLLSQVDKRLEKLQFIKEPSNENAYLLFRGLFTTEQIQRLTGVTSDELKRYGSSLQFKNDSISLVEYFNFLEFWHYLQDQILKDTDCMSMTHSVEVRVPFLDHKLVECVLKNAAHMRLGKKNKSLLVDALQGAVPDEICSRTKMGFTFPFGEWFKQDSHRLEDGCLNNDFFNNDHVHKIWQDVRGGNLHWSRGWALYVLSNVFVRGREKTTV